MSATIKSKLVAAQRDHHLIRLQREFESTEVRGYVIRATTAYVLVSIVSDRIRYDGFECLRPQDILDVRRDPYALFAERALELRDERAPKVSALEVRSFFGLLRWASTRYSVVSIHLELKEPDVCHIGHLVRVAGDVVDMRRIAPDARWEAKVKTFPVRDITRVAFGGDYETALGLVGGAPPAEE